MERLMPHLVEDAAQSIAIDSFLYTKGLDGRGMYRITRVVPEKNEVYGMLVEAEPLSKPWWRWNADAGIATTLPRDQWREVPVKKKKMSKKQLAEANRSY
jgi:hypothetical protein